MNERHEKLLRTHLYLQSCSSNVHKITWLSKRTYIVELETNITANKCITKVNKVNNKDQVQHFTIKCNVLQTEYHINQQNGVESETSNQV